MSETSPHLDRPDLSPLPPLGSLVEFIYLYEVRYIGELSAVNDQCSTFTLLNVNHFGNENRVKGRPLPALDAPHEWMEFNWRYAKRLRVVSEKESKTPDVSPSSLPEENHRKLKKKQGEQTRGKRLFSQITAMLSGNC